MRLLPILGLLTILAGAAHAQTPSASKGQKIAQTYCASCHAVGRTGKSPNPKSPPFRTLHDRYPVEDIQEALVEGISTGHHGMPEFTFDEASSNDLIAYLKTLERRKK
ncbi:MULTISPECIES: c-type cytochrome [Phenylobacterium]|jgi:mono/diheme cytochrome c family protein|uniref:Cytochrome c n=1 Tax=Phenylobacterium conjunctum TaxID=1298959 RepID=A0ABW3T019_9CAUL